MKEYVSETALKELLPPFYRQVTEGGIETSSQSCRARMVGLILAQHSHPFDNTLLSASKPNQTPRY